MMHERIRGSTLRILPRLRHSVLVEAPDQAAQCRIISLCARCTMTAAILSQTAPVETPRVCEAPLTGAIAWTGETLAPEDGVLRPIPFPSSRSSPRASRCPPARR
jgi:hypothetical protein